MRLLDGSIAAQRLDGAESVAAMKRAGVGPDGTANAALSRWTKGLLGRAHCHSAPQVDPAAAVRSSYPSPRLASRTPAGSHFRGRRPIQCRAVAARRSELLG